MANAKSLLDRQILDMRWRCLSLAADLDRLQRCDGGLSSIESDRRLQQLRDAMRVAIGPEAGRAERVQMIFSDQSPQLPLKTSK